jgi:hypothetical protein
LIGKQWTARHTPSGWEEDQPGFFVLTGSVGKITANDDSVFVVPAIQ